MSHLVSQSQALTGPAKHLSVLCVTTVLLLASGIPSDAFESEHRKRATKSQPLVVCGMTGCFDVPPGCDGVVRRSGWGVVALVVCEKDKAPHWR